MNDVSLDELMAQFRELEGNHTLDKLSIDPTTPKTIVANDECRIFTRKNMSLHGWSPLLFFAGGILLFTIVLISIARPRFLYTDDDTQSFLWKRYFLTICIVWLFLLATIFGLYYYLTKQWFLM
ncbi:MAG: hypothetical protein EB023_13260 [Flavobacteriia bacterium]|nr:hypothetical protein [Flavobacteriia bacterium]